jgi:hypothetical protein
MAETPRTRPAGLFCGGWSGLLWGGLAGGAAGLFLAAEIGPACCCFSPSCMRPWGRASGF